MLSTPETFSQAILKIEALSSTPPILAKIYVLLQDPKSNVDDMAKLIQTDTALTTDIMRLANSPYYGSPIRHSSVLGAVSSVGLREVFNIIEISLAKQMFARDLGSYGITAEQFWKTSVLAAILTELVAKQVNLDPREAYLVGLLHATGRVLINQVLQDFGFCISWDEQQSLREWEVNSVGLDSADAGSMLLRRWYFPESVCDVIQNQHGNSSENSLGSVLQFVCRVLPTKFSDSGLNLPTLEDPFLSANGMTTALFQEIYTKAKDKLQVVNTMVQS